MTTDGQRKRKGGTRDGLFQRRGWWWLDYYDADGKRDRKKATPDYNTAKLMYRDLMSKIAKGEVTGIREEGVTVSAFVDTRYWPTVKPTVSDRWATRTRGVLDQQIIPRFGALALTALRRELIEAWYAERCAAVKASTANKELGRLKHLLTRAVDWGYLRISPAARVRKLKEPSGRARYLTDEERTRLLDRDLVSVKASDGRAWTYRRTPSSTLRAYIVAALQTGARRCEPCRLTAGDVDWKTKTITLDARKEDEDAADAADDGAARGTPAVIAAIAERSRPSPPYDDAGRAHTGLPALRRDDRPTGSHVSRLAP